MSREKEFYNMVKSEPDDQPSMGDGAEELTISEDEEGGEFADPDDQPSGS